MEDARYDPADEYEYEDYAGYRSAGVTNVGLPTSQLALIIGVNAVISLIISIGVVLLAGGQVLPEGVSARLAAGAGAAEETAAVTTALDSGTPVTETVTAAVTPVQFVTYVVEPGDTLSLIAEKFSVSLFDLMVANGLTNDFIQAGQELIIPLGGLPTATPTFTPVPVPTDTPLPFEPPTPLPAGAAIPPEPAVTVGPTSTPSPTPVPVTPTPIPTFTPAPLNEVKVVVSEITGVGDLYQETIVILNQGAGTSLKDWKLEGSSLGIFVFPDIFLFSGGSIRIHTAAGENTPSDLYLNQGEPAWPPGATIILSNANNAEISRFRVPVPTTVSAPPRTP